MSANPYPPTQSNPYPQGQPYGQNQPYPQGQPYGQGQPQQQQPHGQAPQMQMNQQQAAAADSGGRIENTGKYLGQFSKVKFHTYPSGASGYILDFQADDGTNARGMFICTINKTGEVNTMGEQKISALLCCLGVQQAQPTLATIMEYDFDRREEVQQQVWLYPEAMNKPVGLVLQREDFTNERTGKDAFRMGLYMAFQASTGRTAKEMIDQVPAEAAQTVSSVVARLGDIDNRVSAERYDQPMSAPQHPAYAGYNQNVGQQPQQPPQAQQQPQRPAQQQSGFPSVVTPNTPLLPAKGGGFYAPQGSNGAAQPNGAAPAQQPVEFDDDIPF